MNNKLAYRLGLETLEEPEVTHPVIELPGTQKDLGNMWDHPAIWTKNLLTGYANRFSAVQQQYRAYLNKYSAVLTRHLELSNDYQKHVHLVETSGK